MNLPRRIVSLLICALWATGCATWNRSITSNPPGGIIYSGPNAGALTRTSQLTPTIYRTGPGQFWLPFCFQVRLLGYDDSTVQCLPGGSEHQQSYFELSRAGAGAANETSTTTDRDSRRARWAGDPDYMYLTTSAEEEQYFVKVDSIRREGDVVRFLEIDVPPTVTDGIDHIRQLCEIRCARRELCLLDITKLDASDKVLSASHIASIIGKSCSKLQPATVGDHKRKVLCSLGR